MKKTYVSGKLGYYLVKFFIIPILIVSISGGLLSINISYDKISIIILGTLALCLFFYLFCSLRLIFFEKNGIGFSHNFKEKHISWNNILKINHYFFLPLYIFITFKGNSKTKKVISVLPIFNTKECINKLIDSWQQRK
ncbi:MAG: hypothetical protein ABIJ59_10480 [Pseudomonadota bacterium]